LLLAVGLVGACGDSSADGTDAATGGIGVGAGGVSGIGTGGIGTGGVGIGIGTGGVGTGGVGTGGVGAGGIGAGGIGAGGVGTGGEVAPVRVPKFSAIFGEIITKGSVGNCVFGACHGGPADPKANGGLHMDALDLPGTYAALVGPVSTSTLCTGKTLVVPGKPQESLLLLKLRPSPPCGVQMPLPTPLPEDRITQIETWIKNGALND
jgi:hypothetical protein